MTDEWTVHLKKQQKKATQQKIDWKIKGIGVRWVAFLTSKKNELGFLLKFYAAYSFFYCSENWELDGLENEIFMDFFCVFEGGCHRISYIFFIQVLVWLIDKDGMIIVIRIKIENMMIGWNFDKKEIGIVIRSWHWTATLLRFFRREKIWVKVTFLAFGGRREFFWLGWYVGLGYWLDMQFSFNFCWKKGIGRGAFFSLKYFRMLA